MPTRRTGRGGVEVRVIGGGLSDHRRNPRNDEGWREAEEELTPADDEEVVRLDQEALPLANRRVEDEEPGTSDVLSRSRGNRFLSQRSLTISMAVMAVLVSVAVVFAAGALKKESPADRGAYNGMQVVDELGEGADEGENLDELLEEAIEFFSKYSSAKTVDEATPMIRNGESLKSKLSGRWQPVGETSDVIGEVMGMKERVVVLLMGKAKGEPFEYFLVRGENGFEVDWKASVGMGDVDFDQLKKLEVGEAVKMRLVLKAATFHPLDFPDEEFRCYSMRGLDDSGNVFGYARIGSEPAQVLVDALNEGSLLLEEVTDLPAIVELKNEGRGELGQFTITKVLEEGWIEP